VLFARLDHQQAAAAGTTLVELAETVREFVTDLAPGIATHTWVSLAGAWPATRDHRRPASAADKWPGPRDGIVVHLDERQVPLDGRAVELTYREFELLAYLVLSATLANDV
jgi:hypothetical protein